jgi:hypothetical protein
MGGSAQMLTSLHKPSKEKSKYAPQQDLHLKGGDTKFPHQRHGKSGRNLAPRA